MVEKAEIERVIDDLETKYDELKKDEWENYKLGYMDGLDYAIDRLRELL